MDFDYNNKILDDLYETRGEELEEFYIAKYGKPKEEQQANLIEEDLINFMKKLMIMFLKIIHHILISLIVP